MCIALPATAELLHYAMQDTAHIITVVRPKLRQPLAASQNSELCLAAAAAA
jgi:hypothetical protein